MMHNTNIIIMYRNSTSLGNDKSMKMKQIEYYMFAT